MNQETSPSGGNRIPVVMAANSRFLPGLLVTSHSLLHHLAPGWSADLTLLTDDFSDEDERVLRRVVEASGRAHTVDVRRLSMDDFRDLPAMAGGSRLTYARLLIARSITADRALYIDTDIVVGRDVSPLLALPRQEGKVLHAVQDGRISVCSMPWEQIPCQELGIPPDAPYFNAGVLWMDLEAWRRQGVDDACREHMQRFAGRLNVYDQSVLNAVLWDQWTPLAKPWNIFSEQTLARFALYPFARVHGMNIHYAIVKPWVERSPFDREFWDELDELAPLLPPERFTRPRWKRDGASKWARFLVMRGYYHYGGFLKQTARKLLGRKG